MRWAAVAMTFGVAVGRGPGRAVERLEGYFVAFEACEAFQSKNKETNPGGVVTEPMRAYEMIALNAPGGDFFQVRVPGAPVTERPLGARRLRPARGGGRHGGRRRCRTTRSIRRPGEEAAEHVLALSWQPAFCEYRPEKAECRALNDGDLPVTETQLSLHGLWPQPEGNVYCGVPAGLVALDKASQWADLPEVALDDETREALAVAMPGTASFLERHEWIKHGTCHRGAGGADEYYDDTPAAGRRGQRFGGGGAVRRAGRRRGRRRPSCGRRSTRPSGRAPATGCRCSAPATAAGRWCRSCRIATAGVIGPDGDAGDADARRRAGRRPAARAG